MVLEHEAQLTASGWIARRRTLGALTWLDDLISMGLAETFRSQPGVAARLESVRAEVREGRTTALAASRELLGLFRPLP
jgi:putative protein kinase ArgK-like GTPase of G3E family